MTHPLDDLRRQAKTLQKSYERGERAAIERIELVRLRRTGALKRADFLHVIAREHSFASWPSLKTSVELRGMDRAAKLQRLKIALAHGQAQVARQIIADNSDLADGEFGLQVALYDLPAVQAALRQNPDAATQSWGGKTPILHLTYSPMLRVWPDKEDDMCAIAALLVANGADVNDGMSAEPGSDHMLSALYGAIGHVGNLPMAQWLLDQGADPNDNESLYHATELGHAKGVRMLLAAGANPTGTNALLRAMDADDAEMVKLLLAAGADPNEDNGGMTALHHAAIRLCSAEVCALLLEHGADQSIVRGGVTPYACARVFGHDALAGMLASEPLTEIEEKLARAAVGDVDSGVSLDVSALPKPYANIVRDILHLPGKLPHVQALVALGMPWNMPDEMGVTPVQTAGWEGLPEVMRFFLHLKPDLGHVNGYGGTLLSTVIHGSENNPNRAGRDYLGCLELALQEGVALPRRAIELAGEPEVAEFLAEWAARYPGQFVEHGVA
ncbi:ankyrin repeat domain-containing protein [Yoonia sp. GPGPB17]|uniref:ankyrin repeat domain-containing protein n=1 Tax=Yoonia sp. GPGPB17 TaxID=3026147 RepID=UPI0030BE5B1C